jgi:hypothetical protein
MQGNPRFPIFPVEQMRVLPWKLPWFWGLLEGSAETLPDCIAQTTGGSYNSMVGWPHWHLVPLGTLLCVVLHILYLRIYLLTKIVCNPCINTCSTFVVICGLVQRSKNLSHLMHLVSAFLLRILSFSHTLFSYSVSYFPCFCSSHWWLLCLKCPPRAVLKYCLLFQSTRRLWWIFCIQYKG